MCVSVRVSGRTSMQSFVQAVDRVHTALSESSVDPNGRIVAGSEDENIQLLQVYTSAWLEAMASARRAGYAHETIIEQMTQFVNTCWRRLDERLLQVDSLGVKEFPYGTFQMTSVLRSLPDMSIFRAQPPADAASYAQRPALVAAMNTMMEVQLRNQTVPKVLPEVLVDFFLLTSGIAVDRRLSNYNFVPIMRLVMLFHSFSLAQSFLAQQLREENFLLYTMQQQQVEFLRDVRDKDNFLEFVENNYNLLHGVLLQASKTYSDTLGPSKAAPVWSAP
jgi:hypothetical protein